MRVFSSGRRSGGGIRAWLGMLVARFWLQLSVCLSVCLCLPTLTLSTAEAAALERELLEDYRFGRQQLVEWCGHASAVAVTKVPAPASQPRP